MMMVRVSQSRFSSTLIISVFRAHIHTIGIHWLHRLDRAVAAAIRWIHTMWQWPKLNGTMPVCTLLSRPPPASFISPVCTHWIHGTCSVLCSFIWHVFVVDRRCIVSSSSSFYRYYFFSFCASFRSLSAVAGLYHRVPFMVCKLLFDGQRISFRCFIPIFSSLFMLLLLFSSLSFFLPLLSCFAFVQSIFYTLSFLWIYLSLSHSLTLGSASFARLDRWNL